MASGRVPWLWLSSALCLVGAMGTSAGAESPQPRAHKARDTATARKRPEPWPRRMRASLSLAAQRPELTPAPTWRLPVREARRLGLRPRGATTFGPRVWPPEPPTVRVRDVASFSRALTMLCPGESDRTRLASMVLRWSEYFEVDPFLLAGLVYHQSRCDPRPADSYGIGFARIAPHMFQRGMRGGLYRYQLPDGNDGFWPATLPVSAFVFSANSLRRPEANLYFAAALVKVLQQQCPAIDDRFGSIPHRHPISHFVWGDQVRGTLPEDHILSARRRLLHYYAPLTHSPLGLLGTTPLSSPLDGAPRVVIGVLGDAREGGRRRHAGIDLSAAEDEPVRAVASGVVSFAGADLRDRGLQPVKPENLQRVRTRHLGQRGLFVKVTHDSGFESLYAHLSGYTVRVGERVVGGQELGRVGRTGMHTSDAHLHLGLFLDGRVLDPLPPLAPYVVRIKTADEEIAHLH